QYALLNPLCECVGTVYYDGIEVVEVRWDKCIRTGGPEGPLAFNLIVAAMWGSTIREWDVLGLGYRIEFATGSTSCVSIINHFLWADNCYVLARSREELTRMLYGLTTQLHDYGMKWEESSLLYMVFGVEPPRDVEGEILCTADLVLSMGSEESGVYRFRRTTEMDVLGAHICSELHVNEHPDLDASIDSARRAFWGQATFFRSTAIPLKDKDERYAQRVQSIVLYAAEGCTDDSSSLSALHIFEGKCLSVMSRCIRREGESYQEWNTRRYERARQKSHDAHFAGIVQKFLRVHWMWAIDIHDFAHRLITDREALEANSMRARRDSRFSCLAFGRLWDRMRTDSSEALRCWGNWKEASSMKIHRGGQESVGLRPWYYSLESFYGLSWWDFFAGSFENFMDFAANVCSSTMLKYFQKKCKDLAPSGVPVFLNLDEDGGVHIGQDREDTPAYRDRLSKRIALHNMRCTQWDLDTDGIPLDIQGDSLLVINWLCGKWKVLAQVYQKRVDALINKLDDMQETYSVRPPEAGRDFFSHSFREWNQRADSLTHQARQGHVYADFVYLNDFESQCYIPCLIKAGFDGGVYSRGSACGVWMQIGLRNKYIFSRTDIIFKDVYLAAWCLPPSATVTDTELSAAERICEVLRRVLRLRGLCLRDLLILYIIPEYMLPAAASLCCWLVLCHVLVQ
ncbi:unnamed protein product, partial [Prorocentrum cordatum]